MSQQKNESGSPAGFPPAGWLRRVDAARLFGIAAQTLKLKAWDLDGRIGSGGKVVAKPRGAGGIVNRGWRG